MKSSLAKYQRWKSFVSIFCVLALFAGMVPTASAAGGVGDHVVSNTVMPSGIVLNLFDYWVTDNRTDPDKETPLASGNQQKYWNTGINQNHALKFTSQGTGNESINQWTGYSGGVYSGIVQDRLLGNYPVLKEGNLYSANTQGSGLPLNQTTAAESLDYLFDRSEQTGKKAFWNVQGLLQIDSDGYYYYNADNTKCWKSTDANHSGYQTANYAAFDEKTNSFKLYDSWGVQSAGADSSAKGQFFPFTDASKVFSVGTDGQLSSTVSSDSNTINHYFGMTMTTRFVQRYAGKTTNDSTAKDMTFEFAGDDDVWLFIDGVLVSDLGGIHNQATTSINFNTGAITVNGQPAGTLKSKMKGYYGDSSIWSDETFADNTYHTMKLFYLERGGTNSNLAMKFNLAHVPETDGVKIDQYGHPLSGVNFTLYAAKPAGAGMSGYVVDTTKGVKGDGVLAEGTTNEDGKFVLSDSLEASVSLNELKQQGITHLLLREKGDRVGYRPMEDIYLQLADYDADILLLNDETHQWRTGSYAQPKETVYANPNITLQNEDGSLIEGSAGTADISDKESGLMFAVIMRRLDGVGDYPPAPDDRWGLVSGSALNGWNITPVTGSHIPAVLDMIHDESNPSRNYFTFTPCSNGSYMTELNNCPGDMRDYYFWREEKNPDQMEDVVYSIGYYYTTAKDLKDATVENTHWVVSRDFERQFTATLYIPNVRNYLRVQKTDTNGKQISGAEFSLYKKEDVTVVNTGTEEAPVLAYTVKDGAKPYDVTETDINGLAEFPSEDCDLDIGEYYLVESRAPDGYRVNATPVHVIVNNDGVLADAGTADDGVSVSLHEGTLLRSMTQYAVSDNVDRTLTDVIATQLRGVYDESEQRLVLSEAEPSVTSQLTVNRDLFSETSEILGYVDSNHRENHWITDEGWIWFKMQQDYAGLSSWENSTAHKRNLGDMDITPLFTGETTVIMQDQPVGSLTVSKTVAVKEDSDGAPDPDQEFQFGITLENEDTALPGMLTLKGGSTDDDVNAPEDETVTLTDRNRYEGTVTLKHGQTFTISDLPVGTTCRVEELRDDLDAAKWKTTVSGAASHVFGGTIKSPGQQLMADFTNTYGEYIIVTVNDAIKVTKAYAKGGDVYDGDVRFTVTPDAGAPAPARSAVTISGKGTGSFGSITFTQPGTYTYTVREDAGNVDHMTYDDTVYTVTIIVEQDSSSSPLRATVRHRVDGKDYEYDPASGMVFTNRYDKSDEPATGTLRISKTVSGSGADQNAEFRFRVRIGALDGTYGSVRFTQGEATVSVKAGGSVSIPGLPAGSAYKVTEFDAAGYTVTSRNDRGMIPAGGSVTAAFNNEKKGGSSSGDGGDSDTPSLNREEHYAYIIGYKDGLLRPNGNISRGEVATIFFRLLRDQIRTEYWSKTNAYSDVPADMWCNNAISTLSNMGILSGYSDGTFRPNAPITRAELTKIAAGFFADKRVTAHYDGRFSDVSGSEWFISALEKAIEEGVVEGYGNGTFAPNQYITRAQACTMINRTLGRKPIEGALLPENRMLTWPDCQPGAWYYAQMQEATNSHDYVWAGSSSEKTEKWTKKLPDRDWAALEHTWSNANSAAGGEAMK